MPHPSSPIHRRFRSPAMTTFRIRIPLILLALFVSDCEGDEWRRYRGPNGSGVSASTRIPHQWSTDDYGWIIDLPGKGHSSPVMFGHRLFVTAADDECGERRLVCIDRSSGDILWQRAEPFQPYKKHKNNSFASSTPCVDEAGVYVIWHGRTQSPLIAFDFEGRERWRFDLGPYTHGQGGATSPIVENGVVYAAHDQKQPSFLWAIDATSGTPRWKVPRAGQRACYSTPCLRTGSDGRRQVVFTHCFEGITGHDLATGVEVWKADVFGRTSQRALGSPVLADQLVIATSGAVGGDRQLVAVQPAGRSDTAETAGEVYRTTRQTPHVPTPLVVGDRLFLVSDQGIASCLDARAGDTIWKHRLGGNFFGSPICAGEAIYCIDVDGQVVVFAAADRYQLLSKIDLGEGSKSTPAVSDHVLYLRTESKLFSVGRYQN